MFMRLYAIALYIFLYGPIALVVIFSFNAGSHAASFECCSGEWYGRALENPFLMEALWNSLFIGGVIAGASGPPLAILMFRDGIPLSGLVGTGLDAAGAGKRRGIRRGKFRKVGVRVSR